MNTKNFNPDANPLYDRECEDEFIYVDLSPKHTEYYWDAMQVLDAMYIPTQMDWHYSEHCRKFLESKGYKVNVKYPFDIPQFHNVYYKYIWELGYSEEHYSKWCEDESIIFEPSEIEENDYLPF